MAWIYRAAVGSALKRAEHRRSGGGEEARVSERSEFRAVPRRAEERRVPVRSTGSQTAARFFWLLFFSFRVERKVTP